MGYKVHSVDGKAGEVDLTHVRKRTINITVPSPAAATHVMWRAPAAATVTAVRAYTTGGTSVTLNATTAGGNLLASSLVAAAGAWVSNTTIQSAAAAVAAGDTVSAVISAAAGTPAEVNIQVEYTVTVP